MSAQLAGPDELGDAERAAVESLLRQLADDELVLAERFDYWRAVFEEAHPAIEQESPGH